MRIWKQTPQLSWVVTQDEPVNGLRRVTMEIINRVTGKVESFGGGNFEEYAAHNARARYFGVSVPFYERHRYNWRTLRFEN